MTVPAPDATPARALSRVARLIPAATWVEDVEDLGVGLDAAIGAALDPNRR